MRGKLVVGNWKMHGGLAANAALLAALMAGWQPAAGRTLAVCVPFPYLSQAQSALAGSPIAWGAQDVSEHGAGAYTGEVSAVMLAEFGCRYAIVGHGASSVRRHRWHAAAKAAAALAAGLAPIACVARRSPSVRRNDRAVVLRHRRHPRAGRTRRCRWDRL
jgi:triosephosphate isomerase